MTQFVNSTELGKAEVCQHYYGCYLLVTAFKLSNFVARGEVRVPASFGLVLSSNFAIHDFV